MKFILKIASIALFFYTVIFILIYIAEDRKNASVLTEIIDPSTAIDSIRGNAKETIVLTPTLEQPFKSANFVLPMGSYGLEVGTNNQSSFINVGNVSPINIEKYGSKYSVFFIDPLRDNKTIFKFDGLNI